jgi:biotin carboxyl carrier protein
MTEAEWLAAHEPGTMLAFLRATGKANDRRLWLFTCACLRRLWDDLPDNGRKWCEATERCADGRCSREDTRAMAATVAIRSPTVGTFYAQHEPGAAPFVAVGSRVAATTVVALLEAMKVFSDIPADCSGVIAEVCAKDKQVVEYNDVLFRVVPAYPGQAHGKQEKDHAALLRDLCGNPFRPVEIAPAWRTRDVLALAQTAYDSRSLPAASLDPVRLAILADALEEAGCAEQSLLDHLRSPGPHVRGCWTVDLVLAKQ